MGRVVATAAYSPLVEEKIPPLGIAKLEIVYMDKSLRGGVTYFGRDISFAKLLIFSAILGVNRAGYDSMVLRTSYQTMFAASRMYLRLGFLSAGDIRNSLAPSPTIRGIEEILYLARDILPITLIREFPGLFSEAYTEWMMRSAWWVAGDRPFGYEGLRLRPN